MPTGKFKTIEYIPNSFFKYQGSAVIWMPL